MNVNVLQDLIKVYIKNISWEAKGKKLTRSYELSIDEKTPRFKVSRDELVGLFSYVETTMRQTVLTIDKGLVPVVDMTGCQNPYLDPKDKEKNWWELFFEQPAIGRDQLLKIDVGDALGEVPHSRAAVLEKRSRWYWGKVYEEYFRPNDVVNEYFAREYSELLGEGRIKTLGVLVRGTDYKCAKGHPKQPSIAQVIKAVKRVEHRYDKIYVATEEFKNVRALENAFPGKIITNKRQYFDNIDMTEKTINEVRFDRDNDRFLSGLEYLSSILLLSKCQGLVAGICGGSVAAVYINNNKYEEIKMLYYGLNK